MFTLGKPFYFRCCFIQFYHHLGPVFNPSPVIYPRASFKAISIVSSLADHNHKLRLERRPLFCQDVDPTSYFDFVSVGRQLRV